MSEALQRQLRSENDTLRKKVNELHEVMYKIKGQNKQLKLQIDAPSKQNSLVIEGLQSQINDLHHQLSETTGLW